MSSIISNGDILPEKLILFFNFRILPFFEKITLLCVEIEKSKIFKYFMIIILLINSICLSFYSDIEITNPIFYTLEIFFLIFYFIQSSIKQITYGLFKEEIGYLNNFWNILEFLELIIGILCQFHPFNRNKYICWFRGLRPFLLIKEIPKLEIVFSSLISSFKEMINVFILLLFIFLSYSVLAVNIWGGIFYRRCRINSIPKNGKFEIEKENINLCGGLNECDNCYSIFDFNNKNKTFLLTYDKYQELKIPELNYGYSTFDNFFKAFLTIYNCMTLNGWSKIMYMVQNGYSYTGGSIFFISMVILLNYIVLNFTIAILMDNFEKKLIHDSGNKKKKGPTIKLIDLEIEAKKILFDHKFSLWSKFTFLWEYIKSFKFFKKVSPILIRHKKNPITFYFYTISQQPIWGHINYIIIVIKIIILCKANDDESLFQKIIDILIIIILDFDLLFKIIGMGLKDYVKNTTYLFNLFMTLLVNIEFYVFRTTVTSIAFLLKTLNIIKGLKGFKRFNIIIELLRKTLESIIIFVALIFILVYVFALIGITLFKGAFDDLHIVIPEKNFETLENAFTEVFSLLIGDDWYLDMIDYLRVDKINNFTVYSYFIFTNILLSLLFMNLVVAVLVYHYEDSRQKQRFKELSNIIKITEKKSGIKRSCSFTYTKKYISTYDMLYYDDDYSSSFIDSKNDEDKLNKSDLFDYEISNPTIGNNAGALIFQHDINTDKIVSKDNFGYGIILKKIKKEKAIDILNQQLLNKRKKTQNGLSMSGTEQLEQNSNNNLQFKNNIKNTIVRKSFINMKKELPVEYKIQIKAPEEKEQDQIFFNSLVDKNVLLNYIKKKKSFNTNIKEIMNNLKIISSEDEKSIQNSNIKRTNTVFNFKYLKLNNFLNIQAKDNIVKELKNKSSKEIHNININPENNKNNKLKRTLSTKTQIIKKKTITFSNRIVHIDNSIFKFSYKKLGSKWDYQYKQSRFLNYLNQSSLFIFHKNSAIRIFCQNLLLKKSFHRFYIILNAISCFCLMLDTPYLNPKSNKKKFLHIFEGLSLFFFCIETIIKIISNCLIIPDKTKYQSKPYFRSNLLNLNSISSVISPNNNSSSFSVSQLVLSQISQKSLSLIDNNSPKKIYDGRNFETKEVNINEILKKSREGDDSISSQSKLSNKSLIKLNKNNKDNNSFHLKKKTSSNSDKMKFNDVSDSKLKKDITKIPYLRNILNIEHLITLLINIYVFIKQTDSKLSYIENPKIPYLLNNIKCLRPLRLISEFTNLKQMFQVLLLSIPSILYMILIALIVFFIYAVAGLNYFKGLLGKCSNSIYKNKKKCVENNFIWEPEEDNFDSITSSILIIYELATTSGWYNIMYKINIVTNNFSPLYFISFMIIGCIFIMNFSVTCVVDTFVSLREIMEGDVFLTENQKEWLKAVKMFMKFKPIPTINLHSTKINKFRKICYRIVSNQNFNRCINLLIIINIISMCTSHAGQSKEFENFQDTVFYATTFIFILEMIIKLITYKSLFFIDTMNIFDFVVVILSSLSIIFSILTFFEKNKNHFKDYDAIPGLIKGIRVLRVFRLINLNFQIKNYLKILLFILPQILNIFTLLIVLISIFIILGISLFSTVKYNDIINDNVNFKNWFSSLNTLIRVLTGDQWNEVMIAYAKKTNNCTNEHQNYINLILNGPQECGKWSSYPFFIFFMVLNSTIVVNMFIAVIVGSFMDENTDSNENEISTKDANDFYQLWSKYDCNVKYNISLGKFVLFMSQLQYPMGLKGDKLFTSDLNKQKLRGKIYLSPDRTTLMDESQVKNILKKLGIFSKSGKIHILDVIKLINKRYIIGQQEKEESLLSLEKYQKELRLFDIKQKNVSKRLKKEFKRYHKDYGLITLDKPDEKNEKCLSERKDKIQKMKIKKIKSIRSNNSKKSENKKN